MPRAGSPYGGTYPAEREEMLALGLHCTLLLVCDGALADSAEHDPPLKHHVHVPDSGCCVLRPACMACQRHQGGKLSGLERRPIPRPLRSY